MKAEVELGINLRFFKYTNGDWKEIKIEEVPEIIDDVNSIDFWNNLYNENIMRDFYIKKSDLPSFFDVKDFSYIQIYIKDYDIQIITYDTKDSGNKIAQMDIILNIQAPP